MIVVIGKTIYMLCAAFFVFYIIGSLKMGDDDFQLWLGEKLLNAWRFIWNRREGS